MARFILFLAVAVSTILGAVMISDTNGVTGSVDNSFFSESRQTYMIAHRHFGSGPGVGSKEVKKFEEYITDYESSELTGEEAEVYRLIVQIILDVKDHDEAGKALDAARQTDDRETGQYSIEIMRDAIGTFLLHRQELGRYMKLPDFERRAGQDDLAVGEESGGEEERQSVEAEPPEETQEETQAEATAEPDKSNAAGIQAEKPDTAEAPVTEMDLYEAIDAGDIDGVRDMLDQELNVNIDLAGTRPLLKAVWFGEIGIAGLLLEAGADPDLGSAQEDFIPLEAAVENPPPAKNKPKSDEERVKLVSLLLEHGADPNVVSDNTDIDGRETTVLTRAIELDSPGVVRLLLENGANPNLIVNDGETALSIAEKNRLESIAELLRGYGAYN
ncbi:ankyrin repeat domain-containing protein [Bacillus marinisedimentorum]|uniref:ankyrin repeat domain-containing protein n=1 Tax=Bacillus marinisedimentorum TaxID=1821260 RepID=UPI0007DED887|nr:ankyrin repeat domain-containing protein [Bacillus marinisedimentorum]